MALIALVTSVPGYASSDVIDQLKNCARTEADQARIECYEALGKAVLVNDVTSDTNESTTQANPDSNAKELTDAIGGGKYARDAGVPKEQFQGVLKSCKKSVDNRWFYIFENGQVWKQVKHKRIRHKSCASNATLTKDGFGYIMRIEGEERKVRVRRQR